jgi:hypothetical protein
MNGVMENITQAERHSECAFVGTKEILRGGPESGHGVKLQGMEEEPKSSDYVPRLLKEETELRLYANNIKRGTGSNLTEHGNPPSDFYTSLTGGRGGGDFRNGTFIRSEIFSLVDLMYVDVNQTELADRIQREAWVLAVLDLRVATLESLCFLT